MVSGPSGVMDWCSPPKLKLLIVFLLVSTSTVCLQGNPTAGVDHHLHCVNDYVFTINCSLSIPPSENPSGSNGSYWLTFTETFEKETFECRLTNNNGDYFCSVETYHPVPDDDYIDILTDTDNFEISLCHNRTGGHETCEVLDENYSPEENIKPNAPYNLTVSHDSSQRHFAWKSAYEGYKEYNNLNNNLKYQLRYYSGGDEHNVTPRDIYTDSKNYSVDDENFVPDAEYSARVRSSPDQASYQGEWSQWSSEVHWRTESAVHDPPLYTSVSGLSKVFIPLCVIVLLILLLCYAPVKKWRQNAFIPTPAPYFHTLYSDCQGDFKSWVVTQGNTADMLKTEETLQIDTLSKCPDVQEEECQPQFHHQFMEGSAYSNIPGCDACLLGVPYAVSTMAPLSAPGRSLQSLTLSSHPGSPAEGDSGCWLSSHTSLERDPPWYCNEYCTLSAFQQTSPVTAEHHGSPSTKSCSTGMMRAHAVTEA